ncbi:sensor histidine kinase [Tropicimonas sp.]|uniref:sensor histidine kinase n=1 Tax=Tropicimonas sp. TaxID=2067044 RepID=UPI003A8B9C86
MTRNLSVVLLYLLAVAGISGGIWWFALSKDLETISARGEADLSVASDRLVGQLQRYREVAVLLADHPAVRTAVGQGEGAAASALLRTAADTTGSHGIFVVDANRSVRAASETDGGGRIGDPAVDRALRDGALGTDHGVVGTPPVRHFTFAAPIYSRDGPVVGAVVVRANIARIETEWRGDAMTVAYTDDAGLVFASNRTELLFRLRSSATPGAGGQPFPDFRAYRVAGHEIWWLDAGRYLPRWAIHLSRPLPTIGMTGEALVDISPAIRLAGWQALFAAALGLVFGALLFVLAERRRALAERLRIEAAANAVLEQRVERRTAELSAANRALRREVEERRATEAALKRAQSDLILAGKLSALGQMSAGISHELNQPLMAISSYAENGEAFLERGKPARAAENLSRIADLARRMGRIIRNLRAFARQEVQPVRPVDLGTVVEAALDFAAGRLKRHGVDLDWQPPAAPVMVMGGEVRLQQVAMNLISNAIDAMGGRDERRLTIRVADGAPVALTVADTGGGIAAPDRIFDPFYSTKEVGKSEGMGLGLSISYRIVEGFGGAIRGENDPRGGAVFTVELSPAVREAAA